MSRYTLGDYVIKNWNSWDRVPREPATIGAKILGAFFTSGTIAGSATLFTAASYVVGYGIGSAVTSLAINALTGGGRSAVSGSQGRLVNTRSPATPQEYVYGQVRKGGVITYMKTTGSNNKYLHMIIVLAGHIVEEIGDIYINDEVVTLGAATSDGVQFVTSEPWASKIMLVKVKQAFGDPEFFASGRSFRRSTAQKQFVAKALGEDHTFKGDNLAYLYVRLEYDQDVFAGGIPTFTAVVKGKRVYDPREAGHSLTNVGTWEWSANPALCIADYIRADYGLNDTDYSRIDDTMLQAAANICDEDITLAGSGTEKQYECHGVLSAASTPSDNLSLLLSSCGGTLFWGTGKWKLKAGSYTSPVKTFTLDDIRSEIGVKTKPSARDSFNIIQGTFTKAGVYNEETNPDGGDWITVDYPNTNSELSVISGSGASFLAEDNGVENILDLDLPFTTSQSMAQRLAKQTLFRNRDQITFSAEFGMEAFEVEVGDTVRLSIDRYGWLNKTFEVVSWSLNVDPDGGDTRVALVLQETNESSYAWDAEEISTIDNNTTLPKFNDIPSFGFTPNYVTSNFSRKTQKALTVELTSSSIDRVEQFELQYKRHYDIISGEEVLNLRGLLNTEALVRGWAEPDAVFSDNLIGSRKIGDLNNDGSVNADDVDIYVDYYFGDLTNTAQLGRINELHEFIVNNQNLFYKYLKSQFEPVRDYTTIYLGKPSLARIEDFNPGVYDLRVRIITKLGRRSDWVEIEGFEVPASDETLSGETGGFASINNEHSLSLFFNETESQSLSHYEVRHSELVNGEEVGAGDLVHGNHYVVTNVGTACDWRDACGVFTPEVGLEFWATGSALDLGGDATATQVAYINQTVNWVDKAFSSPVVCGAKTGTYTVRAISKNGTPSVEYARVPLRASDFKNNYSVPYIFNTWTVPSNYVQGMSIIDVTPNVASFPDASGGFAYIYPVENDGFKSKAVWQGSQVYDHGVVSTMRVTADYDFVRLNMSNKTLGYIDDVVGEWDNLGMNVDDISNEYQSDYSIRSFVRMRDQTSDEWSDWHRITSNLVQGRYFDFKTEVTSDAYYAGPTFYGGNVSGGVYTGGIFISIAPFNHELLTATLETQAASLDTTTLTES